MVGEERSGATTKEGVPIGRLLLIAIAFGVVTRLGLLFVAPPENISYFWPAGGFLLAAMALTPRASWRALLLAIAPVAVGVNWAAGRSLPASIGFTVADVAEAWPGVLLLLWLGGPRPDLGTLRQVLALALAAAPASALLSAALGAFVVTAGGARAGHLDVFLTWSTSVLVSNLVVAPFVIACARLPRHGLSAARVGEAAVVFGLLTVATLYVFGAGDLRLLYLPFLFVVWAALRFEVAGAALASMTLAVLATLLAVQGVTPLELVAQTTGRQVQWLQLLIGTTSVSSLALAASLAEQGRTAARLRESEARQRLIVDGAPMGIVLVGEAGDVRGGNVTFAAIVGRPLDALVGRPLADLIHEQDRAQCARSLGALVRGERERTSCELRLLRPDGMFPAQLSGAALRDERGRFLHTITLVEDVSERRRLEERLVQSQKTEAIGKLAGGVAHDFNNLLTVITVQAELAGKFLRKDPAALEESLSEIHEAAQRGAALTQRLLAFARKQVVEPRTLDLGERLRDLVKLLKRLLTEDIELRLDAAPGLWPVRIDPSQLEQVVMNLTVNARDAMPKGGVLLLGTENRAIGPGEPADPGVEPGDWVVLSVVDTGSGMDEEVRRHLFEPYFSTKPPGKGTGLGLPTVQGIVLQNGGHIALDSARGRGTTFRVWLPRAPEEAPAADKKSSAERVTPRGYQTVLVVEDEAPVRRGAVEVLRSQGYEVLEAPDAESALALSRARDGRIHLLLTDVVLPAMNGRELADALRRERRLRVLFTSGYTDTALSARGALEPEAGAFLPKPYTSEALLAKVRDVLGVKA